MKVADFFCGGGGFSEGFRQAGFQLVFAVDKWKPAVETYKGNKPGVNVLLDDVIRISYLNDDEFEKIVPDSEVIIGSPPCQAFSQSNKSGNADKTLGIQLIEAYLRIVARKKFKNNSILKYWVLENVPNSQKYIKEKYTAQDLELEGDFTLYTRCDAAGIYNAKNFGAPTNRRRFLCGDFPALEQTHKDDEAVKLKTVLNSLGNPLAKGEFKITDVNYPDLVLSNHQVTDFHYVHELAPFEWKTAKRLKQDKGYMGKMSFPENENNPARTVMATIAKTGKEGSIFFYKDLWDDFLQTHMEKIPADEETMQEMREKHPGEDLSMLLKSRDNEWIQSAKGFLKGNLNKHSRKLEDKRAANKPADLIERALSALQSVDQEQDSFLKDRHILEMVKEINRITWDMKKQLEKM